MKNIFVKFGISVFFLTTINTWSQVEDQNPNFEKSLNHYFQVSDSLTQTLGTTVQQTYKAYDWYEAREERRALRRAYRHQERMNRSYYSGYNYDYGYYPSYYNYSRWIPRIGFRTGDFWFSF